jgi:cytoskeletal protein CcmA (bactofilin family)
LRIDGRLEGSIHRADLIVIGQGASVVGDITAREVIVGGAVTGNIFAGQRTELQSTGIVAGDIRSAAILVPRAAARRLGSARGARPRTRRSKRSRLADHFRLEHVSQPAAPKARPVSFSACLRAAETRPSTKPRA